MTYSDFLKTQPIMSDQLVRFGQLVWDQRNDAVVIQSLKDAYNFLPNKIDCSNDYIDPDQDFLDAINTVLRYYMTDSQYKDWTNYLMTQTKSGPHNETRINSRPSGQVP